MSNEEASIQTECQKWGINYNSYKENYKDDSPISKSSIFSKLTFSWINRVVYKKIIEYKDLFSLEPKYDSRILSDSLIENWIKEKGKAKPKMRNVLWNTFGKWHLKVGILAFIDSLSKIASSVMLGELFKWLIMSSDLQSGIITTCILVLVVFTASFLHHHLFFQSMTLGLAVRTSIISMIYRKAMFIKASNESSTGKIINMISNDSQKFDEACNFLHFLYIAPLEMLITFGLLIHYIGFFPALAGVCVLLLFIPLQWFFAKRIGRLRKSILHFRDERTRYISDIFHGIQVVKFYAWHDAFCKNILGIRNSETKALYRSATLRSLNETLFFASPGMISFSAFTTLFLIGGTFELDKMFTAISLFNVIRLTMTMFFPNAIQFVTEASISLERIETVMLMEETQEISNKSEYSKEELLKLTDATLSWSSKALESKAVLGKFNFSLKRNEFMVVMGRFGSGKSSLLMGILNEMNLVGGNIEFNGKSIAFASQQPWIINTTIKDNIVFGKPFDEVHLDRVIKACGLDVDLQGMAAGINTAIGERGFNLSGGQKTRICLARALYDKNADLYLLDDVLSAVDNKVGNLLFKNIQLLLKDKACILITHQLQYVKYADKVLILEDGSQSFLGSYTDLMISKHSTVEALKQYGSLSDLSKEEEEKKPAKEDSAEAEVNAEDNATGSVTLKTYSNYVKSGGGLFFAFGVMFLMIIGQAVSIFADYWLVIWTEQKNPNDYKSMFIYTGIIFAMLTCAFIRAISYFYFTLGASVNLFQKMLACVVRAQLTFFQKNPHGRILNRFTKDQSLIDENLPWVSYDAFNGFFYCVGVLVVIINANYWIAIAFPFLVIIFQYYRRSYLLASRQVKRIESVSRSPVISLLSSTLEGLAIIRAFKDSQRFITLFIEAHNINTSAFFTVLAVSRWIGFRLDLLSSAFFTVSTIACIIVKQYATTDPKIIAFGLMYVMQLLSVLQWCTRQFAEVELLMTSTERIISYTELPSEAKEYSENVITKDWPQTGMIQFKNMNLDYGDFRVLSNINLTIKAKEKVGIVGRTGAGKSSFVSCLFRLFEPNPERSVFIDAIPISDVGLTELRQKISIIPQDPFLFKGTLRFNLDPFERFDDSQLWSVLEKVELKSVIKKLTGGLDCVVVENGSNFSVGERQLICLARAILRSNKIIIMDEATANIDTETTMKIQKCMKENFADATVLTIAHRLQTVIDYNKIMVLDKGHVIEFDHPFKLLNQDHGLFVDLVKELGPSIYASFLETTRINFEASDEGAIDLGTNSIDNSSSIVKSSKFD